MKTLHQYYPRLVVTTEPTSEPVTLDEFKTFCQYEDSDQDALMSSLLKVARRKVENDCDVALMTQTRKMYLDSFPDWDRFDVHLYPVTAVAIAYEDENSDSQTFSSTYYTTDFNNLPPRVVLKSGQTWPTTEYGVTQAVTVTITAGFASAALVPEEAKTAIKLIAREWFYNRCPTGETGEVGGAFAALCNLIRWRPAII